MDKADEFPKFLYELHRKSLYGFKYVLEWADLSTLAKNTWRDRSVAVREYLEKEDE